MNNSCLKRLLYARSARTALFAAGLAIAVPMTTGLAVAQDPATSNNTVTSRFSVPKGYSAQHSVDMGGRVANKVGSGAMYNTMVNQQSGPRVNGETLDMHKLATNKKSLADNARITGSGFGGDPYNFLKLTAEKNKIYEFTGLFRRNRQYFDYDLLGNPNNPAGITVPIGPSSAPTGSFAWPQVQHSSVMTNSVRRMLDTDLKLFVGSKVTFRFGYSQNIMQGNSLLPSRSAGIFKYSALLAQYQRHSTDEFRAAIDWTPVPRTLISFEQIVLHNKENSYFTLDPNGFLAQEADGTPVYLGNWDLVSNGSATTSTTFAPYSSAACNSLATAGQVFTASSNGGLPVIDPTCAVVTSYTRTNPTRITMPTETLRFQSSSIKNVSINGQASYSWATLNMPNYFESGSGLNGATRTQYFGAYGSGKREVYNADLGVSWEVAPSLTLSDQVSLMSSAQPGHITYPSYTKLTTPTTPTTSESINYAGTLTSTTTTGGASQTGGVVAGTYLGTTYSYFGVEQFSNTATVSWYATPKANFALSYRYGNKNIGKNNGYMSAYATTSSNDPDRELTAISEQAGIFHAAYRVNANWDINGSVEAAYNDNSYTTATPRQTRRYRVHTKFRPEKWATFTAAYNDVEKHNNTYNTAADGVAYYGQLKHEEYTRTASISGMLTPNEHVSVDFDYAYTRNYTATNTCYTAQNSGMLVGTTNTATSISPYFAAAASLDASGAPQVCRASSTANPSNWYARMFADAPTQYGSVGVLVNPNDRVQAGLGYRINSVAGSQFFIDARDVNGAMASKYQTPYLNASWKVTPALTWKAEYNYFGYGENGPSGAKYCTMDGVGNPNLASSIVPCASMSVSTGMNSGTAGMTAPRNFHANNISLGLHYEF
jgi:hypothetical protein